MCRDILRWLAVTMLLATSVPKAMARPVALGRVGMVARGELAADAIGTGARDGRAQVTVRIPGGSDALRRAGFDAQPLAGDVATLRTTVHDLRRLLALSSVVAIEERRVLRPLLDASAPAIGAPVARLETALDGQGVLVAVVDTGLDFRHADFRRADGSTRVAALLDLSIPRGALHPELPDYNGGAAWVAADIDAVLAAEAAGQTSPDAVGERDVAGHGTHVAGIAAGNGLATGRGFPSGRYVGIAPGADLIAVQASQNNAVFTDSDVVVGCRFAVEQAERLGRPVAVNLSLGGPGGPHDGSTNLERAIDALFPADKPGRAVAVAAGNDGALDQHAGGWSLDRRTAVQLALDTSEQADSELALNAWYNGMLSITVVSPSGRRFGPVAPGQSLDGERTAEGHVLVDNASTMAPRPDGRQAADIAIVGPSGAAPAAGNWTLILDGHAPRWDIWVADEPSAATSARFINGTSADDRLAVPATAHNAIVVGSFVSRNQWTTVDDMTIMRTPTIGFPSVFSATGPTADDRFAPDVLAPGEFIVSSLSRDASPDSPKSVFFVGVGNHFAWADDGVHGVLRGTSQATPHVAGTLALLLEADPSLTPAILRELLRTTARDELGGYTPRVGFGKLDVLAALRYLRRTRGATVSPTASSIGVSRDLIPPGDATTVVTVTPRDDNNVPLGPGHAVAIWATAGDPTGEVVDTGYGRYERTFAAHAPLGTIAVVSAAVDGVPLASHRSIFFVESRADIGGAFVARGGCSLAGRTAVPAGRTAVPAGALLVAGALLLWRTIKSRRRSDSRTLRS
jgi:subtilisin family serine protease